MDIEVIMNHRVKAKGMIANAIRDTGINPTTSLVEEFLCFYDYNGLNETLNNVYRYANTVTNRLEDQYYIHYHTVFY